jgi:hypothetical protein
MDALLGGDEMAGPFELGAADRGVQVGHPVIPPRLAVPVYSRIVAGLADQVPGTRSGVVVAGEDGPAAPSSDDLVQVEADRREAAAACRPAPAGRADPLRGVFDHGDPMPAREIGGRVEVGRVAEQVDGSDSSDRPAGADVRQPPAGHAALPGEELFQQVRVELPVTGVDVEGDRVPTGVAYRVRCRDERPGGHDHLISRTDSGEQVRDVQGSGC